NQLREAGRVERKTERHGKPVVAAAGVLTPADHPLDSGGGHRIDHSDCQFELLRRHRGKTRLTPAVSLERAQLHQESAHFVGTYPDAWIASGELPDGAANV